jgi:lipopolysaccharide/colanic/teichoic acid biosynthesis glycosyltransferase
VILIPFSHRRHPKYAIDVLAEQRMEVQHSTNGSAIFSRRSASDGDQQESIAQFGVTNSIRFPRWKRIFDLTSVLICSPVWVALMIGIALWIKIASRGPVFYRQKRIGFRGEPFMMFKFRTMNANAETVSHERYLALLIQRDSPMTKLDASGDHRIIRGGRILRALGLDEVPQLINVLRGEMSLVGPRPCTPNEFQGYEIQQRARVNAPPGLTGLWQVNGKNRTTFSEMIDMDIFYTKNMSLRLDLQILLRTVPAISSQVLEMRLSRMTRSHAEKRIVGAPLTEQKHRNPNS